MCRRVANQPDSWSVTIAIAAPTESRWAGSHDNAPNGSVAPAATRIARTATAATTSRPARRSNPARGPDWKLSAAATRPSNGMTTTAVATTNSTTPMPSPGIGPDVRGSRNSTSVSTRRPRSSRRSDHRLVDDDDRDPEGVQGAEPHAEVGGIRRPVVAAEVGGHEWSRGGSDRDHHDHRRRHVETGEQSATRSGVEPPGRLGDLRGQQGEPAHGKHRGDPERRVGHRARRANRPRL